MSILQWLRRRRSVRGMALSLYKHGMARARRHDHRGAIDDYTRAIGLPDAPGEVIAMVLYNRALVHVASGDDQQCVDDLDAILAIDEVPVNIRTMARQKLARMESQSRKGDVQRGWALTEP